MSSAKSSLICLSSLKDTELAIAVMMLLSISELSFVIKNMYSTVWGTKGISGLLWFLMITFLTPVAIKQYGIMGLIISVLALLNIFSDIFKYKMNFVNEKRIVNFLWSLGMPLPPWRSGINATWW